MGFFDELLKDTRALDVWMWGPAMIALLFGTGLYLTFRTRGIQFTKLIYSLKLIFSRNPSTLALRLTLWMASTWPTYSLAATVSFSTTWTTLTSGGEAWRPEGAAWTDRQKAARQKPASSRVMKFL